MTCGTASPPTAAKKTNARAAKATFIQIGITGFYLWKQGWESRDTCAGREQRNRLWGIVNFPTSNRARKEWQIKRTAQTGYSRYLPYEDSQRRLLELAEFLGVSHYHLAKLLGVPYSQFWSWKRGSGRISQKHLFRLALLVLAQAQSRLDIMKDIIREVSLDGEVKSYRLPYYWEMRNGQGQGLHT